MNAAEQLLLVVGQSGGATRLVPVSWSPTDHSSFLTISGNNLIATRNNTLGGNQANARSDTSQSSGLRTVFFTILQIGSTAGMNVGLANGAESISATLGESANSIAYRNNFGSIRKGAASITASPGAYTTGDILGMKVDFNAHTVAFNKNGGAYNTAADITSLGTDLFVACGLTNGATFCSVALSE